MEDDEFEKVFLFLISETELRAIAYMAEHVHYWHSEMLRLSQENENMRQLIALLGDTLNKIQGVR